MKNLRALRESKQISQTELGTQLGLAQSQIQNYEKGVYEPGIDTLKRFAAFFETSVDYLIGSTEIKRKIERVAEYALNADEQNFVDALRQLQPKHRDLLIMLTKALGEIKA